MRGRPVEAAAKEELEALQSVVDQLYKQWGEAKLKLLDLQDSVGRAMLGESTQSFMFSDDYSIVIDCGKAGFYKS